MNLFAVLFLLAAMLGAPAAPPLLPSFAGWRKIQSATAAHSGWGLPAPDAVVMAEYGLRSAEHDIYQRGDRKIQVEGLRFGDAEGSYGAFTYFRGPGYSAFDLAQRHDQGVSDGTHILFTRGVWLIRVTLDQVTAMTAADMRQFAANLSSSAGDDTALPTLPYYLPRANLVPGSVRFVEGPAGFAAACSWLPADTLGFSLGAQAVVASYDPPALSAPAALVVLSYPTPQMARTHLAGLQGMAAKLAGVSVRRSGPFVIAVQGAGGAEAASLLQSVNYDADVTLVPPTPVGLDALPSLILGIVLLCGMIMGIAIVLGLLTGGLRVMLQRVLPKRFRRSHPEPIISLHLDHPSKS